LCIKAHFIFILYYKREKREKRRRRYKNGSSLLIGFHIMALLYKYMFMKYSLSWYRMQYNTIKYLVFGCSFMIHTSVIWDLLICHENRDRHIYKISYTEHIKSQKKKKKTKRKVDATDSIDQGTITFFSIILIWLFNIYMVLETLVIKSYFIIVGSAKPGILAKFTI
jgi:hypothetical protein